jgi:YD repeat-containing protein
LTTGYRYFISSAGSVISEGGETSGDLPPSRPFWLTLLDPARRPRVRINGLGIRVTTVFDPAGRSIGLVDGNANWTTFVYDAAGRKIREVNPLLARLTYGYDAVGRETLRIDPHGVRVSYGENELGKQTGVTTYSYDAAGNQSAIEDCSGDITGPGCRRDSCRQQWSQYFGDGLSERIPSRMHKTHRTRGQHRARNCLGGEADCD